MHRFNWIVVPLILLFFWLAVSSMVDDSPTMDEQNHIARGITLLRTGDPRLSLEHPPLINMVSALPLLTLSDLRLPTDHPSWSQPDGWYEYARLLLWEYNDDVTRMVVLARLPIIFIMLGMATTGYRFARDLWGDDQPGSIGIVAGLLALFLLLFDPNLLAHGRYSTTDIGGAACLLLAVYLLWRLWRSNGWPWGKLLAAALGLGLAFAAKLSILAFAPILMLLALLPLYDTRWTGRDALRRLAQLIVAGALSVAVIWALYAFQWGPLRFEAPGPLAFLNGVSGPMPTFWAGVERIGLTSEIGRMSFLGGAFSDNGFRQYFPVAFVVKTPLTILALVTLAGVLTLATRGMRRRALFLLLPALIYFLLSIRSGLNIGYRHLFPMLPLLYVLVGGLAAFGTPAAQRYRRFMRPVVITLCTLLLATTLWIAPHYISYFNQLVGGPRNGYRVLVDSNVDWGQDLIRLQRWMAHEGVDTVNLSYFGSADPAYLDLAYTPLPGEPLHRDLWWDVPFDRNAPEPGVYVISVHNLQEMPLRVEEKTVYAWFRAREPDAWIGNSLAVYEVP